MSALQHLVFGLFLLTPALALGQTRVWILAVGISDYQHLNDLTYADADAREFLAYARQSLGNRFVDDQVRILLNEQATNSAISIGLQWILRNAGDKDRVYIYFSGHGGYEDQSASKLGFLHAYDSYDATYVNGGNIGLIWLEDKLRLLAQRNVNTFLILDACHAGKVGVDDHYFLNNSLSAFMPKVNKVLSAQGTQGSLESPKWGGGHGVFTYYMLQGIMGHADDDPRDNMVSMFEIEKYLLNNVPRETNQRQMPMVITSDKNAYLFPTIAPKEKSPEPPSSSQPTADSSRAAKTFGLAGAAEQIIAFKSYLHQTDMFTAGIDPIMGKYGELRRTMRDAEKEMELIDYLLTYVLDHSQTFINAFMGLDEGSTNELKKKKAEYILANSATQVLTLIGNDHPSYATLESKRIFFDSEIAHNDLHHSGKGPGAIPDVVQKLTYAISLEPQSSYLRYQAGVLSYHAGDYATARRYLREAGESSPLWSFPEVVSGLVSFAEGNLDGAAAHYRAALRKKPLTPAPYLNLADCFERRAASAADKVQKRIQTDSMIFYLNAALPPSDNERRADVYEELANAYEQLYTDWNDKLYLRKAIIEYKKAVDTAPSLNVQLCDVIASLSFRLSDESADAYFFWAVSEAHAGKKDYLRKLEQSLKLGFAEWEYIKLFPSNQQSDARFQALISQYKKN